MAHKAQRPLLRALDEARAAGVSEAELKRVLAEAGGTPSAEQIFELSARAGS
jgi:hypothetical protein